MTEAEPIHPGLPVLYDRDAPYVDPEAQTVRLVSYTGRDYVNVLYSGLNGVEDASFDDDSDETRKLRNFVADVRQLGAYVGQNLVLNEAVNLPHPEGVILDPQTDAYLSQMGVAYTDAFPSVR
jgi:hypothetical protein